RTIAELRELRELTGDDDGAQRVCWTPTWRQARGWLADKMVEIGAEVHVDAAGNQWGTVRGRSPRALLVGGHIDSVPDGGWLDGSLNLLAGLEVMRRVAEEGPPGLTFRLVDWADEEGATFGVSLFGSSAAAGNLDPASAAGLLSRDGEPIRDVLARCGVELDRIADSRSELRDAVAYLELHIEQGPVLESRDLPLAVVAGTFGAERWQLSFSGQTAHAGSTPMDQRQDAFLAAARLALEVREIATAEGGVGTVGTVRLRPGIVNAVPGRCRISVDLRHLDAGGLSRMLQRTLASAEEIAAGEGVEVTRERLWRIDPIPFDGELIALAREAVEEVAGQAPILPSGPLHDAAEASRAGLRTVMLFVQSLRGLSHTREEDTREDHLRLSVQALDVLTRKAMQSLAT
ncbi:MAG: Zn-dependent hydrolase, partial [Thermoanaerobaculia bacterium]|nr:Zn-dependent hydrolase [Thermoanaerobaculia bacterium]